MVSRFNSTTVTFLKALGIILLYLTVKSLNQMNATYGGAHSKKRFFDQHYVRL